MSRRLFDVDPLTGLTRYFHPSDDGNSFTIETVMDVEPIIEANKRSQNDFSAKAARKFEGDWHRVARIPMHTYFDLLQRGILKDEKKLKQWLNDPENMYYRTKLGRV